MEINVEDIVKKTVLEKGYIPNEIEALISLATMGATIVAYKEKRTDVGQVQDSIAEALIRLHMMTYNYGHDRIAEIVAEKIEHMAKTGWKNIKNDGHEEL